MPILLLLAVGVAAAAMVAKRQTVDHQTGGDVIVTWQPTRELVPGSRYIFTMLLPAGMRVPEVVHGLLALGWTTESIEMLGAGFRAFATWQGPASMAPPGIMDLFVDPTSVPTAPTAPPPFGRPTGHVGGSYDWWWWNFGRPSGMPYAPQGQTTGRTFGGGGGARGGGGRAMVRAASPSDGGGGGWPHHHHGGRGWGWGWGPWPLYSETNIYAAGPSYVPADVLEPGGIYNFGGKWDGRSTGAEITATLGRSWTNVDARVPTDPLPPMWPDQDQHGLWHAEATWAGARVSVQGQGYWRRIA